MNEEEFKTHLNELLNEASPEVRKKLEGLQWKIDNIRLKYKDNHTGCLIKIFEMMFNSIKEMQQVLEHPTEYMKQRNLDKCDILNLKDKNDETSN